MPKGIPRAVQDRNAGQLAIIDKFGRDALESAASNYCASCRFNMLRWMDGADYRCRYDLLPLTIAGGPCPHYTP